MVIITHFALNQFNKKTTTLIDEIQPNNKSIS